LAAPAAPSSEPARPVIAPVTWLAAVGLCVLAAWIASALVNSEKLRLRNAPARPNTLGPAHIAVPLVLLVTAAAATLRLASIWLPAKTPQNEIVASLVGQLAWLVSSVFVAAISFRFGLRRGLGLSTRHWKFDVAAAIVGCLASLPICLALADLASYIVPKYLQRPHEMLTALDSLSGPWPFLIAFSVLVMAPLSEEIFIRGLVQSLLRKYTNRPWPAIIFSSGLFAVLHYQQPQNIASLFALGVILGYIYERHGRLLAPILMHSLFNTINLIVWIAG